MDLLRPGGTGNLPQPAASSSGRTVSHVRYRKQVNHKLARFYASGPVYQSGVLHGIHLMQPRGCGSTDVICVGDFAKISDWHERFWVKVVRCAAGGSFEGIICNVIIASPVLQMGHRLRFRIDNVFAVAPSACALHRSTPRLLARLEVGSNVRPLSMRPWHHQWHTDHLAPVTLAPPPVPVAHLLDIVAAAA